MYLAKWLQKQFYDAMQCLVLSSVITCPASNYISLETEVSTGDIHHLDEVT